MLRLPPHTQLGYSRVQPSQRRPNFWGGGAAIWGGSGAADVGAPKWGGRRLAEVDAPKRGSRHLGKIFWMARQCGSRTADP